MYTVEEACKTTTSIAVRVSKDELRSAVPQQCFSLFFLLYERVTCVLVKKLLKHLGRRRKRRGRDHKQ